MQKEAETTPQTDILVEESHRENASRGEVI